MADYKLAIGKVLQFEGGYSNDPTDNGEETYRGISRKFWPRWDGWKYVDAKDFKNPLLKILVIDFYKVNFWDKIEGSDIKSQSIADHLIDSAVNEGVVPAIKRAQTIVGLPQTGRITDELVIKLNLLK